MITPPNGSAEANGMKEMVSSAPRQRKALTPMPEPPPALCCLPSPLPIPKITPLSSPPTREEMSPGEPLPKPPKFAGVGFGLLSAQPAAANTARKAAGRSQADDG